MRKAVIISLFIAFLFQSLSSLFILASFYINRDYISENLCVNRFEAIPVCQGSCYLGQQLGKNEQQQQELPNLKLKEPLLFFDHHQLPTDKPVITAGATIVYAIPYDPALSEGAASSIFKPPVIIG